MGVEFEWNPDKAKSNQEAHGINFLEAVTVFADPLARIFEDDEHSEEEPREIIIGHSAKRRLVLVCFTVRGRRIRIIGARKATPLERKDYEENVRY
ncbi:MAG: BrnT family toxin [Acidobacteriota bacterium]|nr:BrnT family toxin [Acidobacteriota bacterium]